MQEWRKQLDLFRYLDYRLFLRDYYHLAKKSRAGFSLRTFSKRAGFTSSNFFKLVMDGDRNLTEESVVKFMHGLGLNKQEQEFFRNLVFYNQSKTHLEKNEYYRKLLQSRKFNQLKPIQKHQYEYYSTWYHAVVRELVTSKEFDGTAKWLVGRITPAISEVQANKSIEILLQLGFVKKTDQRFYEQSSPLVTTGAEAASLRLINYHQNLLELARNQLPEIKSARRDISALVLGVPRLQILELKKKIQEFRNDILKMVSTDAAPEEVVFLNIQMFPATKCPEEEQR